LEAQRDRAQPPRLCRRAPLPEALRLVVEVEVVDDRAEIGAEGAAAFEPAQDLVLVLDDPELDGGGEVLGVGATEAAARADPRDDALDRRELGEEQLLACHWAPQDRAWAAPSGLLVGSMIRQVASGALGGRDRRSAHVGWAAARHARPRGATVVPRAVHMPSMRRKLLILRLLAVRGGGTRMAR